jgi:excinuclease ABC subunit A
LRASETTTGQAIRRRGVASSESALRRPSSRSRASTRRGGDRRWLHLEGATQHNIKDLDVDIPLGTLTVVTGVSGSGKSTLVDDILFHALERELRGVTSAKRHLGEPVGTVRRLRGAAALDAVVLVDQSPIGRTPRSNPITYIQAFGEVRKLFAEQPLARQRDYGSGHFSFNIEGGRCPACKGAGEEIVEMVFMADVSLPCEVCEGRRFRAEVLEVEYRGLNVHDVLQLTVDEAIRFFIRRDRLGEALWQLQRVGLGYLRLGQPATTLSGGEAQRLKVARELTRSAGKGRKLYCLDEPTVGLGLGEIETLVSVLRELVGAGNTVLVVEHNLDVIAKADWIIDLGPEAAADGGRIVAEGPPASIAAVPESHTGRYLRRHLAGVGAEMAASG